MRRLRPPRGGRSQYLAILVLQAWFPPGLVSLNRLQPNSLRYLGFTRHAGRKIAPSGALPGRLRLRAVISSQLRPAAESFLETIYLEMGLNPVASVAILRPGKTASNAA